MQEVTYFTQKVHVHHTWHTSQIGELNYKARVRVTRWGNSLPVGKMKKKIGEIVLSPWVRLIVPVPQILILYFYSKEYLLLVYIYGSVSKWTSTESFCRSMTSETTRLSLIYSDDYSPWLRPHKVNGSMLVTTSTHLEEIYLLFIKKI